MGRFFVTYVLLVPCVARKHRLVQVPGPDVAAIFLSFLVLAQGRGWSKVPRFLGPLNRVNGHF